MTLIRSSPSGQLVDTGGGGSSAPLPSLLFVDPTTTTPPANQDGSTGAPFATIAQGVAALLASPVGAGTLVLCAGDYAGEVVDWAPPTAGRAAELCRLTLWGSGSVSGIGGVNLTGSTVESFPVSLALRGLGDLNPDSVAPAVGDINALGGYVLIDAESSAVRQVFRDSSDPLGYAVLLSRASTFDADAVVDYVTATDCDFRGNVEVFDGCEASLCRFVSSVTVASELTCDNCLFLDELDAQDALVTAHSCVLRQDVFVSGGDFFDCQFGGGFGTPSIEGERIAFVDCQVAQGNILSTFELAVTRSAVLANIDAQALAIDTASWNILRYQGSALSVAGDFTFIDQPPPASQFGWDASSPITLDLLGLPHPFGIYRVDLEITVNTPAAAGSVSIVVDYTDIESSLPQQAPVAIFEAGSFTDNLDLTASGARTSACPTVSSDGSSAVQMTLTPTGVSGAGISIHVRAVASPIASF